MKESKSKLNLPVKESPRTITSELTTEYIIKFLIIMCSLPYRLVETAGFRRFMDLICPKWQSVNRYAVQKGIKELKEKVTTKIKTMLNKAEYISLTVDLWSDRRLRTFLGVTAHFIDSNFKLISIVLSLKEFLSSHTGEAIYNQVKSIIHDYNIENKIFKILTDNCANIKCAIRLVSNNESKNNDSDIDSEESESDLDEEPLSEDNQIIINKIQSQFYSLIFEHFKEKSLSCFNHTLQLVVKKSNITSILLLKFV